jgi:hypothetical protein
MEDVETALGHEGPVAAGRGHLFVIDLHDTFGVV